VIFLLTYVFLKIGHWAIVEANSIRKAEVGTVAARSEGREKQSICLQRTDIRLLIDSASFFQRFHFLRYCEGVGLFFGILYAIIGLPEKIKDCVVQSLGRLSPEVCAEKLQELGAKVEVLQRDAVQTIGLLQKYFPTPSRMGAGINGR
jgi:hypothetical protein